MAPKRQSKWRLMLRAVLFTGNVVAFVLLIQDASQPFSYSDDNDDDRPANAMPYQMQHRVGAATLTSANQLQRPGSWAGPYRNRKPLLRQDQTQTDNQQQQDMLLPDHPMMKVKRRNKNGKQNNAAGNGGVDDEAFAELFAGPPPNFTHYFIHIPKAGGTYARHQLNNDVRENRLIREQGILCDRGISPVSKYKSWPSFYEFNAKKRNKIAMAKAARTLDQGGEAPIIKNKIRRKCGMYMTESHYSSIPQHVYTIVRDPREHLVSAYFHCKESKLHGKRFGHLMPDTLDEWLNIWTDVKRGPQGPQKEWAIKKTQNFRCYNPINMQSSMLLSPTKGGEVVEISKAALAKRFDVIGLTSQMDKSLCLVFIAWNGFAPSRCVCGGGGNEDGGHAGQGEQRLSHSIVIHSHNVTNHGGTHEHTPEQLSAIAELASADMKLYAVAEELFEDKVAQVEKELSIKLC